MAQLAVVVDASIAAAWFLPDERNEAADAVMAGLASAPGRVPSLFWFETRSLFLNAERRGRLAAGEAALSMAQLRGLSLQDEGSGGDSLVLTLAARRSLSAYDASYLALAIELALPLATNDRRLAAAARLEGVAVRGRSKARHERRRDRIACRPTVGRQSANPAGPCNATPSPPSCRWIGATASPSSLSTTLTRPRP